MTKTIKKQFSFYADSDVEKFIDTVPPGIRSKTINDALRLLRASHKTDETLFWGKSEKITLSGFRDYLKNKKQLTDVEKSLLGALEEFFARQD